MNRGKWKAFKADLLRLGSEEAKDLSVGMLACMMLATYSIGFVAPALNPLGWGSIWAIIPIATIFSCMRLSKRFQLEMEKRKVRERMFEEPELVAR